MCPEEPREDRKLEPDAEFGDLTIIEKVAKTTSRRGGSKPFWRCRCKCGNVCVYRDDKIRSGRRVSCGCRNLVRRKHDYLPHEPGSPIPASVWQRLQEDARVRGLAFSLTLEYLGDLFEGQSRKCALSGEPLVFMDGWNPIRRAREATASLDRKDAGIGYEPGNVQWVRKELNQAKGAMPDAEFVAWCCKVADHSRGLTPSGAPTGSPTCLGSP